MVKPASGIYEGSSHIRIPGVIETKYITMINFQFRLIELKLSPNGKILNGLFNNLTKLRTPMPFSYYVDFNFM